MPLETPIAFFVFNRPHTTRRVFSEIARAKPRRLLVVADGPRSVEEEAQCRQTRNVIAQVDWDCEVLTDFSDVNLGCKARVSSGLDWVFRHCEEAIVLEDDCLPHPAFFPYCEEMLARYRHDDRIMMVNGNNFEIASRAPESYYFSQFPHVWGWASWRRAWRHYDVALTEWPTLRETSWLAETLGSDAAARKWAGEFDAVRAGRFDTWDFQWSFAIWNAGGTCVAPNGNLITNIGFGEGATHTKNAASPEADLPAAGLTLPLRHPPTVAVDVEADERGLARILGTGAAPSRLTLPQRLRRKKAMLRERFGSRLEKPLRAATSPRVTRALLSLPLRTLRSGRGAGALASAERILVIRLDEIGDLVLTAPFLRELRRNAPDAWITLVVKPETRNLMELCPYVNEVLAFGGKTFGCLWPLRRHVHALRFARTHLWKRRFDLALLPRWDVDQSHATFLAYFSGAAQRVGYSEGVTPRKQDQNRGYDRLLTQSIPTSSPHELERGLDVLSALGGTSRDSRLEAWLSEEDRAYAAHVFDAAGIQRGDRLVALGIGAGEGKRVWPAEWFLHLGQTLLLTPGLFLLLVGGEADCLSGQQMRARLGERTINAVGKPTLRQTSALLERCRLFIGNDSGPAHLAAAVGVPVIQLNCHPSCETPRDDSPPARFSNRSAGSVVLQPPEALAPCLETCEARQAHCITGITVQTVLAAVEAFGLNHRPEVCKAL